MALARRRSRIPHEPTDHGSPLPRTSSGAEMTESVATRPPTSTPTPPARRRRPAAPWNTLADLQASPSAGRANDNFCPGPPDAPESLGVEIPRGLPQSVLSSTPSPARPSRPIRHLARPVTRPSTAMRPGDNRPRRRPAPTRRACRSPRSPAGPSEGDRAVQDGRRKGARRPRNARQAMLRPRLGTTFAQRHATTPRTAPRSASDQEIHGATTHAELVTSRSKRIGRSQEFRRSSARAAGRVREQCRAGGLAAPDLRHRRCSTLSCKQRPNTTRAFNLTEEEAQRAGSWDRCGPGTNLLMPSVSGSRRQDAG